MNIVFLARRFHPLIGGVEKHVFKLSKLLIKKGHNVTVITLCPDKNVDEKDFKSSEVVEGVKIIRINAGKENFFIKFRIWFEIIKYRGIFEKADVVHCHDVFYWYLPLRFLMPAKPVFTTFHGYEKYPVSKRAILVRKLTEVLSKGNICIGDFISKWYGTKPDIVSYGAVDLPGSKRNESSINKNSAVFIGRLDDQTGILDYVEATHLIRKRVSGFELLAVGDGPLRILIEEKVKVTGFINEPEKYFSKYRFAFVSRYLSILEAMINRRLVFALYDNPIKEDYLEMAPFSKFIVIEENPGKLAEKVVYYLSHPEHEKKKIEMAYNWAKAQTWDKMAENYLELWGRVIK